MQYFKFHLEKAEKMFKRSVSGKLAKRRGLEKKR
jgi:hypothetical protein